LDIPYYKGHDYVSSANLIYFLLCDFLVRFLSMGNCEKWNMTRQKWIVHVSLLSSHEEHSLTVPIVIGMQQLV